MPTHPHSITDALPAARDILIVEDEPKMASLLTDYLAAAGYATRWLAHGDQVVTAVQQQRPALVLLDLMLPGCDGITVCRALRAIGDVPIIMLTARAEEGDRLLGLEVGADDYICKTPFSPREVVARVRALLRRAHGELRNPPPPAVPAATTPQPAAPTLHLDEARHAATLGDRTLALTPIEYRLLKALANAPGRVFSREQLLGRLHPDQRVVTDRAIDSHIKNLRRKLQATTGGPQIQSVYGVGYRFDWA